MKSKLTVVAALLAAAFAAGAQAQTAASTEVQRNADQQQRIQDGLKDGSITTQEAAKLEKGQAKVDKLEAKGNRSGSLSAREKAKIDNAQDKQSAAISRAQTNGVTGNPDSKSSQRMQADVQRNIDQQQRIQAGVQSGQLTGHETARLEKGQAKVDKKEARAGKNGYVSEHEQSRIQRSDDRQSEHIDKQSNDGQFR
jgi:hypothetical protein